jgi:CIC family chloride channel protein
MSLTRTTVPLVVATISIGVFAGIGSMAFHFQADRLGDMLFHGVESQAPAERAWRVVLIPTIGVGLVGLVLHGFPRSRLGGIREVRESLERHGGLIPVERIVNVILSGFVQACGGSVGPEGPMVQMGALLGSLVGQRCRIAGVHLATMVRAGAAAGISAAFGSPAGGVLLTVEVLGARFDRQIVAISTAAVLGYVVRTAVLGDERPFRIPGDARPVPLLGLLVVAPLMGLMAAPAGTLFVRAFERFPTLFPRRWPLSLRVAFGGLLVGTIGIAFPQVMSAGYPLIVKSLRDGLAIWLGVVLLALKMLATCITFGTGAVGGLFAPALVMGALFGGAFGHGFHAIWPKAVPQPELFVLLGMIVMFGSIIKGYWSGLMIVADLSGAYHALLLPGLIAGGLAFLVSWQLHQKSIFGFSLEWEREVTGAETAEKAAVAAGGSPARRLSGKEPMPRVSPSVSRPQGGTARVPSRSQIDGHEAAEIGG